MPTSTAGSVAEVVHDLGAGPPVALLHGVGFGPDSFAPIAKALAERHRVLLVKRPTSVPGGVSLAEQASAVAGCIRTVVGDEPVVVAGASGGATLALAIAVHAPELAAAVVAHEPLFGRQLPELAAQVRSSAARLAVGEVDPDGWFAGLVGPAAWLGLDPDVRAAVAATPSLLDEVEPFVSWEPAPEEVDRLRAAPVVTTVGGESGAVRAAAARQLGELVDATVVVLPECGHLVQVDAPSLFAEVVSCAPRRWVVP